MSADQTENQTQTLNTGELQNSDSSKENPKRDHRTAIRNAVFYFLEKKSKVLNDPIHGLMELHPLLIKIMDTPQFQRLRHIKQLGGAYFVYPGGSHNRFEHSVGVAHLAGELARALRSKQPELEIDERDILCVQIAGLCHDLGHGPFSHLYDGIFIPEVNKKKKKNNEEMDQKDTPWKHEDASLRMFDHLVEDNDLKPLMKLYGLKPEENDLDFIKEMIQGKQWPYKGRTEEKSFLYEIVSNKLNGIDVDKFDYLARDAYHLGMQSNFDHKRFIMLARVCEVEEKPEETKKSEETKKTEETKKYKKHICSRDKEVGNLYDMFHTRYCLHRRVCQHKTHKSIEIMISDAFLKADEHIMIEGSDGKMFTLSTAKDDMVAYTKLTDQVFERILHPWSSSSSEREEAVKILQRFLSSSELEKVGEIPDPKSSPPSELEKAVKIVSRLLSPSSELEEARQILERIVSRRLYKFVGEAKEKTKDENPAGSVEVTSTEKGKPNMSKTLQEKTEELKGDLAKKNQANDFEVPIVTFDYGRGEEDPINNTFFYSKDDNTRGFKISENQKSKLLPKSFSEKIVRVYCKNPKKVDLKEVREVFKVWCKKNDFTVSEDEDRAVKNE